MFDYNWFENYFGFRESDFESTKSKFKINDGKLVYDSGSQQVGRFFTYAMQQYRIKPKRSTVRLICGDIATIIMDDCEDYRIYQVASQMNCLEHKSPNYTREHGINCYVHDRTQGPQACLMSPAALVQRNYFEDDICLIDNLCEQIGFDHKNIVKNGYLILNESQLEDFTNALGSDSDLFVKMGVHENIETRTGRLITQVFCSAVPVAYNRNAPHLWKKVAFFFLKTYYRLTLNYAVGSTYTNKVVLTLLGAGAFGNDKDWVYGALEEALEEYRYAGLDIKINNYGPADQRLKDIVARF